MDTSKINGTISIVKGKIIINFLSDDEQEIKSEIDKLLVIRDVMDNNILNHEKDVQKSFGKNIIKFGELPEVDEEALRVENLAKKFSKKSKTKK